MRFFGNRNFIFIFLTFLAGIFILFTAPRDPDFGWHFKYGEYLIQNREFLRENTFSYNMENYEWANSYWTAQVVSYSLYSSVGEAVAGVILAAILSGSIILILKSGPFRTWQVISGSVLLFIGLVFFLAPVRPLLYSSIFMLFLVYVLLYKKSVIKFLPLLFLIWANTHADFTLGLFVLGIYNIRILLLDGVKRENLVTHATSIACIGVTLINPYGVGLWETLLKETHPLQFSWIAEWVPMSNCNKMMVFFVLSGLLTAGLIEMKNKRSRAWLILAASFFLLASTRSQYFSRVFYLLGIFPAMEMLEKHAPDFRKLLQILGEKNKKKIVLTGKVLGIIILTTSAINFTRKLYLASNHSRWSKEFNYPYEEINFIKSEGLQGKMFNPYGWGGYLIWQLPEHRTFIDGRMPSWRENDYSLLEDYIEITEGTEEGLDLLEKYTVSWALYHEGDFTKALENSSDWKRIRSFEGSAIFIKIDK